VFKIFVLIVLLTLSSRCFAQSKFQNIGDGSAVVFQTEFGSWTANHAGHAFRPTHFSATLDIQFRRSKTRNKKHFKIGPGPPVAFVSRRGKRFEITSSDLNEHVWSIDKFSFFAGESGSPVFNKKGEVCGVVLGNYLENGWHGRAAKLSSFIASMENQATIYGVFE